MSESRVIDRESRRLIREELLTNILVEAGAGSGKTQMLAERMAAAAVPTAGEVIEVGEDIVEASEDVLDDVEAHVPAGSVVGQVIDLALVPGRFGLRIATTVLRGDSRAG